jgi:hypothetical protein
VEETIAATQLERLHQLIEELPAEQVMALLTLLEPMTRVREDEAFDEIDEATVQRVLAAEQEPGENISLDEMKRRLNL